MSRIFTVLFLSSVCVFGLSLCQGQFNPRQRIEFEIARTKEEIVHVIRDGVQLREETNQLRCICWDKINTNKRFLSNSSGEIQAQQKTLQDLYQQLAKSYAEEDQLSEAPADIEMLRLGIKVVQEDIQVLQQRREDGTAKSSLELVEMTANATEAGKPSILSWGRDCYYTNIDVENQLRLARIFLAEAVRRREGQYMKLECTRDKCNKVVQALVGMLEKLGNDGKKVQESVDKVKEELEEQKKKVAELTNSAEASKTELDKLNKEEVKKVLDIYQQYALEVYSYEKLVQTLVLT